MGGHGPPNRSSHTRATMFKRLLLALFLLFVAMNTVAFFHAWRFTRFAVESGAHTANPEKLTAPRKLWLLLTGVKNPKPRNSAAPDFPYVTLRLPSPNGRL